MITKIVILRYKARKCPRRGDRKCVKGIWYVRRQCGKFQNQVQHGLSIQILACERFEMKSDAELEEEATMLRIRLKQISRERSEIKHGFKDGDKITVDGNKGLVSFDIEERGFCANFLQYRLITADGAVSTNKRYVYESNEKVVAGW